MNFAKEKEESFYFEIKTDLVKLITNVTWEMYSPLTSITRSQKTKSVYRLTWFLNLAKCFIKNQFSNLTSTAEYGDHSFYRILIALMSMNIFGINGLWRKLNGICDVVKEEMCLSDSNRINWRKPRRFAYYKTSLGDQKGHGNSRISKQRRGDNENLSIEDVSIERDWLIVFDTFALQILLYYTIHLIPISVTETF